MSNDTTNSGLAGVKATVPDALELRALAVIGLIEAHDGPAALLRSSRGQIARVQVGESAFGVEVTAIGNAQVVLTDVWGRTQSLTLPHS